MARAAYRPCCMATGATPGSTSADPSGWRTLTMSPSASTSGWPGTERSPSTARRPARSTSIPACWASMPASGEAVTPAAQMMVRVAMRSVLSSARRTVTLCASTSTTDSPSRPVTPRLSSERSALAERLSGKLVSTRSSASTSRMRAVRGSMLRKSPRTSRAISAIWPAISTPVGPAPTTTKVSSSAWSAGSGSSSAASKAARMWRRMVSAPSSDLSSAACSCHSSWPKYEYCEPPETISVSYSSASGAVPRATSPSTTRRAARSTSTTSARTTRTLRRRRKMRRSG
jgi:hypothetical protein